MKILINALSARVGGGKTYLINLLRNLPDDASLQLLVYTPSSLDLPLDPRIERRNLDALANNPLRRFVWERLTLPGILKREGVDLLFCPGGLVNTSVPGGCRTVTMFRNMQPFDPEAIKVIPWGLLRLRTLLLKSAMLRSMRGADLVIFISHFARGVVEALIPISRGVTIPHGVPDIFKTAGTDLPRPAYLPDGKCILYVSRFEPYKHHLEVVQGYAQLPEALQNEYRLILVGEPLSPHTERVEREIREGGLSDRIRIVGGVEYGSLPGAYRNSDMILFASSCENCPNILLEALGAGRPTLTSDIEPMPEFAADAALYFAPGEPGSIAAAIIRMAQDPALAGTLADRAAVRSLDFAWSKTAKATWKEILST
ncbi:glycosyltransferase family 4 protein [Ralstonia mojiangensis]|uniref:glycosyltransferase family 4 protein n=1 Tax=Ralstonia mojiangensis TaxID=2953895 RepID=UPI0021B2D4B4|nr:glycosyltransferase family 1 protein [Ralstonia mojiangensis]MCT7327670.1 glycosyltransferase family 4 protein [Ralstonia mojiangensis]